ncbi:unnamed protein product [Arctia plantaginis]|uniref:Uncharacterized protein n=1 Tax=Arctia plantaginis TaxID=874455 RepID=A0A8S0ZBG4_ARCPL|nr:unnamed protein product [Arctia plantaginis]CAB3252944.1 unnamed protein product [Arctia plantaginis]
MSCYKQILVTCLPRSVTKQSAWPRCDIFCKKNQQLLLRTALEVKLPFHIWRLCKMIVKEYLILALNLMIIFGTICFWNSDTDVYFFI